MFRRSGSFVSFYVAGQVPAPSSEEFTQALAGHRFRDIAAASSEETSVGWVTPSDPTGESFDTAAMELDGSIWLRFRTDKKKLPAIWVQIHRAAAEQSAGRKLSPKERKDLKEDLQQQLLPRILPSVSLTDALYRPREKQVLLFGTSVGLKDTFRKLFAESFGCELLLADAYERASRSGLSGELIGRLASIEPVRWPRQENETTRRELPQSNDEDQFAEGIAS